ncbi:hypothetical protein Tco_0408099 [Tanacetum coccineum]
MASSLGCTIMENKFRYLGVMVRAGMTRHKAWDDVASPLYNMSIFKVPKGVLKVMESIRSNFFKGASMLEKKISWIAWDKVLASKKKGGLRGFEVNFSILIERDPLKVGFGVSFRKDDSLCFVISKAVMGIRLILIQFRKCPYGVRFE